MNKFFKTFDFSNFMALIYHRTKMIFFLLILMKLTIMLLKELYFRFNFYHFQLDF